MKTEKIIDGKYWAGCIKDEIKLKIQNYADRGYRPPKLVVLQVGDNPASTIYVKNKKKDCDYVGIEGIIMKYPSDIGQSKLIEVIRSLNQDATIDGILCQMPLPEEYDESAVIETISPEKDVDGLHPVSQGYLITGSEKGYIPCTPLGIITVLKKSGINLEGLNAVVIGRSRIVGKPMAMMLLKENATVTITHSKTRNLQSIVKQADIIIAAAGSEYLVKDNWVKEGVIIIDVGMNRTSDGKWHGDVSEEAKQKASYYTPVPGGVGPLTRVALLQNTIKSYEKKHQYK